MRSVFFDASVLFAASMSARGRARDLIALGLRGDVSIVVSSLTLDESRRNILAKAPSGEPFLSFLAEELAGNIVDPPEALIRQVAAIIHPKDAAVVAAAVHADATWLATYDRKHLLSLRDTISRLYAITTATPDDILNAIGR